MSVSSRILNSGGDPEWCEVERGGCLCEAIGNQRGHACSG